MTTDTPRQEPADGTVRVNKLLAERGICSRREADRFIERGWVLADGERPVSVGERVPPGQVLSLDSRAHLELGGLVTILLHKPLGYVSGQAEEGYTNAATLICPESHFSRDHSGIAFHPGHRLGLAPAGRLDIDSTGLLVLTQNGTIARQLVGDGSEIEKEYEVRFRSVLSPHGLGLLNHGLQLDRRILRPAKVTREGNDLLRFILREGRKRQIRRMCELVGIEVVALKRVRIGRIRLGNLPYGKWRYLGKNEAF